MKTLVTSLWLLDLALLSTTALGQSAPAKQSSLPPTAPALRTYQGEYEGGRATYTYYLNTEGRRVRHGRFVSTRTEDGGASFSSIRGGMSQLATIGTSSYHFDYRTEGSYADGQRTGRWTTTKTSVSTTNSLRTGPVSIIDRRTTFSQTYQNNQPNGLASYTDVPWHAGKPGTPAEAASARRRTQATAYQVKETLYGKVDTNTAPRDTTITATEYAAGFYRYDAAPALSDPAHRPQSVRGRFDAEGYCDSTWTLHYWKGRQELADASDVQHAQGWMTTIFEFSHGLLRRERTTQASTGEVIHQFVLPLDTTARRQLISTPAHFYDFSLGDNNRPETPDRDWQSPLPEDEDASHYFFAEATRPLGPPRLLNFGYRLVLTAADSLLLSQCETVLEQAPSQWPGHAGRPAADTTGTALRTLCLGLFDAVAATHAPRPAAAKRGAGIKGVDSEEEAEAVASVLGGRGQVHASATSRTDDDPYPWLRELLESPDPSQQEEQQLSGQLALIRQRLGQVQARLEDSQPALRATNLLAVAAPAPPTMHAVPVTTTLVPLGAAAGRYLLLGRWANVRDAGYSLTISESQAIYQYAGSESERNMYTVSEVPCERRPGHPAGTLYLALDPVRPNPRAGGQTGCLSFEVDKDYLSITKTLPSGQLITSKFKRIL